MRGLRETYMKSFFFFFVRRKSRSCDQVRMIDTVRPIRINVIGSTSRKGHGLDGVGIYGYVAGGPKLLHNQPRLNTFQTPDG